MIYNVYALFDKDLCSFSGINAFQNDIVVNRYYENILNNSGSDNFLFKIKMAIKQTIEGITGLIITIIPKYEPNEKPKEAEKEKKL